MALYQVQGKRGHCRGIAGRPGIHRRLRERRGRNAELRGTSVCERCAVTADELPRNRLALHRPYHTRHNAQLFIVRSVTAKKYQ